MALTGRWHCPQRKAGPTPSSRPVRPPFCRPKGRPQRPGRPTRWCCPHCTETSRAPLRQTHLVGGEHGLLLRLDGGRDPQTTAKGSDQTNGSSPEEKQQTALHRDVERQVGDSPSRRKRQQPGSPEWKRLTGDELPSGKGGTLGCSIVPISSSRAMFCTARSVPMMVASIVRMAGATDFKLRFSLFRKIPVRGTKDELASCRMS